MPKLELPDTRDISDSNIKDVLIKLIKALSYYFLYLDDDNVRPTGISNVSVKDVDGVKLFPSSVADGKVIDLNGTKLHTLSVADGKVSDVSGGKLHTTSIPTSKHKASAIAWSKVDNSRITNSFAWSLAANAIDTFHVEHATLYNFAGPPMIRAQGDSSGTYVCPFSETAFTYYSSNVAFYIRWQTEKGFMVVGHELSGSPRSGNMDWYRDGILDNGVS